MNRCKNLFRNKGVASCVRLDTHAPARAVRSRECKLSLHKHGGNQRDYMQPIHVNWSKPRIVNDEIKPQGQLLL